MKRIGLIVILLFIAWAFAQCEVDDICTEEVLTPRLTLKCYDADDPETPLSVENLTVWAEGKDTLYKSVTQDSLLLPLNPYDTQTTYLLAKRETVDTLKITYTVTSVFVSRSCGYKYNFTMSEIPSSTTHWIRTIGLTSQPQIVDNEAITDVKIYH